MEQAKLEAPNIYAMCANMGLNYGPSHQGIIAIYLGKKQLLAQLCLPAIVEASQDEYVLHPSLMDSALQASIGLIIDLNHVPSNPFVPFVLESVRILSACTKEMVAWVRYPDSSKPEDKTIKLDIDLCDQQGNVCVQMQGLVSRVLENTIKLNQNRISDSSVNDICLAKTDPIFDSAFYQRLIADILSGEMSVDEATEVG